MIKAETAQLETKNNYLYGVELLIFLNSISALKVLKTKVPYKVENKEVVSGCLLEPDDEIRVHSDTKGVEPTKITSLKCMECQFGGKTPPNPTISCNIFRRS